MNKNTDKKRKHQNSHIQIGIYNVWLLFLQPLTQQIQYRHPVYS